MKIVKYTSKQTNVILKIHCMEKNKQKQCFKEVQSRNPVSLLTKPPPGCFQTLANVSNSTINTSSCMKSCFPMTGVHSMNNIFSNLSSPDSSSDPSEGPQQSSKAFSITPFTMRSTKARQIGSAILCLVLTSFSSQSTTTTSISSLLKISNFCVEIHFPRKDLECIITYTQNLNLSKLTAMLDRQLREDEPWNGGTEDSFIDPKVLILNCSTYIDVGGGR